MCSGLLINDCERVLVLLYLSFHNVNGFVFVFLLAKAATAAPSDISFLSLCVFEFVTANGWNGKSWIKIFSHFEKFVENKITKN